MRKHALKLVSFLSIALAVAFLVPSRAAADEDDPPTRVARLSHTDGSVSFNPAGTDDWVTAVINRPMTTGDKLWSDNGSRAELHIGSASLRIGGTTGFSFLNLTDEVAQLQVTEGTLRVRVKRLDPSETFEIDTPNLAFSILRPGTYRINVNESGDTTVVSVFDGEGEVTGGGQAYSVHANQTATFSGTDQLNADVQGLADSDDFEQWCTQRDRREDHSSSARYVSPDVIGYEDLDDYGGWRQVPEYGTIWFPHTTVVGWAPYRYGHWAYISPWGYTWVEDEPWGFAPFHYGRWVAVGGVWGWVPCRPAVVGVVYVRPVYAPALVAWVGGPHFAVGVGVGGGVGVGWFPLGPREVYVPSYRVSRNYVNNVNISNTTVNTTVVNNYYNTTVVNKNVTNVTYVNQRVPGAVTATSTTAFTSAQPVGRNLVKVDQRDVVSAPVSVGAPAVPPARQSVLGSGQVAKVRPPATLATRAVVAKTPPPPPPPTFERQQVAIRQNGGQPLGISQQRQLQPANVQAAAQTNVKIAPPARTVTPVAPRNVQVNRPVTPQNGQPVQPNNNRPTTVPPNSPANTSGGPPANGRQHNDRPPTSQPSSNVNPRVVNPQVEQKQQQQLENLRKQQDQERQRVEQQQVKEQQKLQQQHVDEQRQQQSQQRQQQQLEQVERKHDVQQQKLEDKQQREVQHAPPPKNDKPPKNEKDKPAKP
jgi:FecR protein